MRSAAAASVAPSGVVKTVDIFNAASGVWTTAALSVARAGYVATSLPNYGLAIFAGGPSKNTVDIFNARSGVWTTAALSVARYLLAATSLPNYGLAIFAGGLSASYLFMSVIAVSGVSGVMLCGRGEVCCCRCC